MEIKQIAEVLAPAGLRVPMFNALVPNVDNYTVLLIQPFGQIEASVAGVRNRNMELAQRQFGKFLNDAQATSADLVVTPEYSMPWDSLVAAIKSGTVPAMGKIWALGCESIRISDLEVIKQDLYPFASVFYETLPVDSERFVSPLAYVFIAPHKNDGAPRTIVLVQFKTHPMGDDDHFEINGMQRGRIVYQFGGDEYNTLKLVSLICSDVFAFTDIDATSIYDRALILNIQLNARPRHEQFLACRGRLLQYPGDETEVLCLNWARNVQQCCNEQITPWDNIACSAWYVKSNKFDDRDATLCDNHRRGLYYTWLKPHCTHALFFNFEPATYLLEATKVAHIGIPAAISRRRGPQLRKTCVWNDDATAWIEKDIIEDGFSTVVYESGGFQPEFEQITNVNPFFTERLVALCTGNIGNSDDWHYVSQLDSCVIDLSEVIHRITFCQDTNEQAQKFRVSCLKRCGFLWNILKTNDQLPPAIADIKDGFLFEWSPSFPHQNIISANGKRATVIYMGEDSNSEQVESVAKKIREFLQRTFTNPDDSHNARQRLAVWYRCYDNEFKLYSNDQFIRYDNPGDSSEFDIGREK